MKNSSLLSRFLRTCAALTILLVSACSSSSNTEQTRYKLYFLAHPEVNASAPLKVKVLQLKSSTDFMAADFYSLQNNLQKVLATNLVNSDEFFLSPSQSDKTLAGRIPPEVRYIAIMSEYQSLDGKKWRVIIPVPDQNDRHFWQISSNDLNADVLLDIHGIQVITR